MSYKSGFFRLWIVLSVCWIISTVFYFGPNQFEYLWNMGYVKYYDFYIDPTLDDDELTQFLRDREGKFEYIEILNGEPVVWKPLVPKDAAEKLRYEKGQIQAIRSDGMKLKVNFILASLFVFFPPIAALVFGLIAVWVVMGFRK